MRKSLFIILPMILSVIVVVICTGLQMDDYQPVSVTKKLTSQNPTDANQTTMGQIATTTDTTTTTKNFFSIILSFVGDCLCATDARTSYENCFEEVAKVKEPEYFLEKVSEIFKTDDFTIADCENVYSDSKNLQMSDKGQYSDPNIEAYWFKTSAKNAKILSVGGIDMVSTSNNHINDYGQQGHTV